MTTNLPAGWTSEDIQFFIEKVKCWPIILIEDQALGIPTVRDIPCEALSDWGYGVLNAITEQYSILYDIQRSPSGKGWAHVDVLSGIFPFDKAAVLDQLANLIETRADNAVANKAALTPIQANVVEQQDLPEREKITTSLISGINKSVVKTLIFHDEGKRLIASNGDWLAICCCSVDRETGEIRYGLWRMYHTNFTGVLDPVTNQQVCGTDVWAILKRTGEIYGAEIELEGAPEWIAPTKSFMVASPLPPP